MPASERWITVGVLTEDRSLVERLHAADIKTILVDPSRSIIPQLAERKRNWKLSVAGLVVGAEDLLLLVGLIAKHGMAEWLEEGPPIVLLQRSDILLRRGSDLICDLIIDDPNSLLDQLLLFIENRTQRKLGS